ncbi:hypothetical protein HOE04_02840 [archaeon]|jgi:hypothetical protein|nr:hypothetical protein [archaeon]
MTIDYNNQTFITDDDLEITTLGFWPRVDIQNPKLKRVFEQEFGKDFLGGDELVAYSQALVSNKMEFAELEREILADIENPDSKDFRDILFNKTATGIGRGHSLGGLSGVVLGVHGTKMIDSGLTGLCASRSLVTSSRRRETGTGDIAIPESLRGHELLDEYMQISEEVFNLSKKFKEKFGKSGGVETFNKVIPYNNPADLFIVLPLDTLATITSEVNADRLNPNGNFVPRELYALSEMFHEITGQIGQNTMHEQRIRVPRDTYLHYTVFKDPASLNYALEKGEEVGMNVNPVVTGLQTDFTRGFRQGLEELKELNEKLMRIENPEELYEKSQSYMYALREFSNEFNESLGVKIADTLSWRVWSEQKRHATLRQSVESVYSGAERAYQQIKGLWPTIESANSDGDFEALKNVLGEIEENIVIDDRLKKKPEVLMPYVYQTAKQLMFYGKMMEDDFEPRDALYIVPKNIRLRTLENYDLVNLINLEFPLRLCDACEPERKASSWRKREAIAEKLPELDYFLKSKCSVGFCTEGNYCKQIMDQRDYGKELHKQTQQAMLSLK